MVSSLILGAAALLPLLASAAPLAPRNNDFVAPEGLNVTYTSTYNSSLPRVVIFATGGTIAGSSASATDTTGYRAGVIGVEALVVAVPGLLNISNIVGAQIANVGSPDITGAIQLQMAKYANEILCSEDSTVDGIVITHGTDTLEETAFFMDATVNCHKPVVIVGAMRPSTAISADGPGNIQEAVSTAVSPAAKDRGALIVLNDRIASAYYSQKTNANDLDTFKALEQGFLGGFLDFEPFFYYPPTRPTFKQTFDITAVDSLPMVDLLISYIDEDTKMIDSAIKNGAKGIVFAGSGAGSTSSNLSSAIDSALDQGVPIVFSTRTGSGAVVPRTGGIGSGFLNPPKSRIQLQLALATGLDYNATKASFEKVLGDYLS